MKCSYKMYYPHIFSKFMVPKRRFWTIEQSVACAFLKYFSRMWVLVLGYHWLKTRSKSIRNALFNSPKSSFGDHKDAWIPDVCMMFTRLCSPNEDFGRPFKHSGTYFQSTFHILEYSIWATFIWKVLRKRIRKGCTMFTRCMHAWCAYDVHKMHACA